MDGPRSTLLLIGTPGPAGPEGDALADLLRNAGYDVRRGHERELERQLEGANGERVHVVLLEPGLERPHAAARAAHRRAPLAHIVFLARPDEEARIRDELRRFAMIGTHWSVLDPDSDGFLPALDAAVRAGRQRRSLRTTLDRLNLRLSAPEPGGDAYRRLVVSDRYLASILDHAGDGIVSVDVEGRIVTWNRTAEGLFDRSAADAIGDRLAALVAEGERARLREVLDKARAGESTIRSEFSCRRRDGTAFVAELTLAPIDAGAGGPLAVLVTVHDITERKRTEEDLRRLRDGLERRVEQRTAELLAANRELEAFSYSVSHDLRAPLRGIDGFSQVLLEDYGDVLDDAAREYIDRIRAGAMRMSELIDDFLALARASSGILEVETVDASALAREVVEDLRRRHPEREVRVRIAEGLTAQADRRLLRIVLENLLGNAWKFTRPRSDPEVGFDRAPAAPTAPNAPAFVVADNGVGFDMAYASGLFAPFRRLHGADEFEGTGIGLATVHRILRRHGGTIWADGEPDRGARFYFTLPGGAAAD